MSTSPFLSDSETIIAESHQQIVRAYATHPSFIGAMVLQLQDISLDWDEQRSPRVEANLTVVIPDNATDLAALDPRTGVRIEIEAGYVRPGGIEDVQTIADLGLREVTLNRPSNTMKLDCASDEMLAIDASPAVTGSITGTSHADAISQLIKACISPAPKITATVTGAAVTINPVTDRWDTMNDLADRISAKVYDNGLREWFISAAPTLGTPDLTLKVGNGGTVLVSDSTLSRDNWFNYVFLLYVWKDTLGAEQVIRSTAYVSSGDFAVTGAAGKRIYKEEREVPTTQAVANAASSSILNRFLARTKAYVVDAIAAYWLRPGMTVSLQLPEDSAPVNYLVQKVSFRPLQGTMTVTTRLSETATSFATTTPDGSAPSTDPVPPAKQTYVSSWVASSSQAYKGDGSKRTDIPTEFTQGYYDGTNGNQRSILLFTGANSTGDEINKTVTQALTGATLIKAEVIAYANHWYYNDGGTARIGYYNGTTIPVTFSGGSPYITVSGWKRNSPRTVNVSSSSFFSALSAGTARGITFGPGSGTNREYYGTFNGATASSNKPVLRLTYSK